MDPKVKTTLRSLKRSKRKVEKNMFRTEYSYAKTAIKGTDRLWARGTSLQNTEARDNQFRQYLSRGKYHDIDQVNSAPVPWKHLCEVHSVSNPNLDDYVALRSEILQEKDITKQDI